MKNNYPKRIELIKPIEVYYAYKKQDSKPHWHTGYLITLVDGGNGVETKNGVNYPIKCGKISVLSPSDIHYNTIGDDGYFSYHAVMFNLDGVLGLKCNYISEYKFPMTAYLQGEEYTDALFIFKMLKKYSNKPIKEYKSILLSLIEVLLKTAEDKKFVSDDLSKLDSITSAVSYLNAHFNENISQKKLANMCGFSADYFGRLFKKEMGVNFSSYLLNLRLDFASRLLISGSNAQEACFGSGFVSFNWFASAFTRKFGVSPGKYVDKIKQ